MYSVLYILLKYFYVYQSIPWFVTALHEGNILSFTCVSSILCIYLVYILSISCDGSSRRPFDTTNNYTNGKK